MTIKITQITHLNFLWFALKKFPKLYFLFCPKLFWNLKKKNYLLQWFVIYLENREFRFVFDGSISESYKISCGTRARDVSTWSRESFDWLLYNSKIPSQKNPLFLGLRFNKYFRFKNQINYWKETSNDRINIINKNFN